LKIKLISQNLLLSPATIQKQKIFLVQTGIH